ncbi:MAG: tryptophan 7-halogenase [Rhizobiales bacterium]|nr:tryptophan 7-halogenase [Rhizobacter sp.]
MPSSSSLPTAAPENCDVLVIGGGPAGATVAALLAQQGRAVVLCEKAQHPRFHIGESLLPANGPLFDKLGVREAVDRIGMPKLGIEFVSPDHDHRAYVDFADAMDKSMPQAWQVRRSELDEVLFRNAETRGAQTLENCRVRDVTFDAESATVQTELTGADGQTLPKAWRARFVIDASGRDTLLGNKLKIKEKNPKHNSSALFGHFTNAERLPGKKEGNISLFWFAHGWFWFIPLADGTTSVGAVCWPYYLKSRTKPLREFFADTIALAPPLQQRLKGATLVDDAVHATGNYSYMSTHATGERYLMLGDAYTFIDPMFSTGVYLAMHSAFEGAGLVATALDRPAEYAAQRAAFEKMMRKGPKEYSWFIFRVTNPAIRELFMHPANPFRVLEALMSMLAGDIYGKTPLWGPLRMLKGIYYMISLRHLGRTIAGWKRHREVIRDMGMLNDETILKAK